MSLWSGKRTEIHLDQLPEEARTAIESAINGGEVVVRQEGEELGLLSFRATVLEGEVIPKSRLGQPKVDVPDGVTVVATAMALSKSARAKLAATFGTDYLVLDLNDAPEDADVLLTHPISLTLLAQLRARFPLARTVVTEINDEESGVSYSGPVSRLIDSGVSAYLPPSTLYSLAKSVDRYLKTNDVPGITARYEASTLHCPVEEGRSEIEE
ncbi:hypothetical protein ACH82I_17400 [Brevibacterium sp. GP-SGM9]|uniref:hypothetical protein n=1 Tax=Brevibacterium sp. GP-SGM9 TaxID=3376990 RepID=UPI0039A600CD